MKKAKMFKSLEEFLNLESRLKFLENTIKVNNKDYNVRILKPGFSKQRCKSCYTKAELAHFFYILLDEGLLFFDLENTSNNRSEFQHFVIDNFSYAGDHGSQIAIKSISKQFSESKGYSYREKQIKFLEEFITRMQCRKQRLENW
ncbi:hypothetical protein [Flavobacterium aquidurense]|uniref:hypothetical protein n=1 Tax=Flavobacterium aquidurense TaxID=362413 RepID=UPI002865F92B|nr:hypothetical protein [Flavobacterium aquidurense]MDR7371039.1 hypothetical protein [Flavobacterium aquidurense]